jgi:hypothetical protein
MHIVLAVVIGIPLFFWCLSSYQRRQVRWVERKLQREQREQEMEQQRQRENAAREHQMRQAYERHETRSYEQILEADRRGYEQMVEADRAVQRRREQGVSKYLKAQGVISDELSR